MKTKIAAIFCSVAALGFASAASATPVTIVYQGIVDPIGSGSIDYGNLFGGGDLGGDAITATFVYDTALGFESTDGSSYDELDGGLDFADGAGVGGFASPIVSASFAIAGDTYSFAPDYYADVTTAAASYVQDTADSTAGDSAFVNAGTPAAPVSLTTSFSDFETASGIGSLNTAFDDEGNSDIITFTTYGVSVSAAPEPASWTLMIAGVGLAGFALRRRSPLAA